MNINIREKLAPLATALRRKEALVQPISQVLVNLPRNPAAFGKARDRVVGWMNDRAGRKLPQAAWEGRSFALDEIGSQRAEAVCLDAPRYWSARIDDADKDVASRTWTTEVSLAEGADGDILLGCRLTASMRGGDAPLLRTIPGFVGGILRDIGATLDGRVISGQPWHVEDMSDAAMLAGLIRKKSRRVDVIVLSLPEGCTDFSQTACSAEALARRLAGAAHVAVVSGPATFHLSDELNGREYSVYRGAVRTYRAGFDPANDKPFSHPLAMASRIATWPNGGKSAYEDMLVNQALARSVQTGDAHKVLPSFVDVKRAAAEAATAEVRNTDHSGHELVQVLELELLQEKKERDEEREVFAGLLKHAESERDQVIAELEEARNKNLQLTARIRSSYARDNGAPAETPIPETLDGFEDWCALHLAGSVEIHSRAFQSVKKSAYQDSTLIYKTLLLLRDYYVPLRRGAGDMRQAFEEQCQVLGLSEQQTGDASTAGMMGEEFFVRHGRERVYLARHFKKGNSRDARFCFRCYFFWDAENEQAVVGWLPSHLCNRLS